MEETEKNSKNTVSISEDFVGLVDARDSSVEIHDGAAIYGAVIGNQVTLDSGSGIYFDEQLLTEDGVDPRFARASEFVFFDVKIQEISIE
ncbi:hypothetical protein ACFQMM_01065 [Saliphagus sp. GCM10025308]